MGRAAGFDLVGIAPAGPVEDFKYYRRWLELGHHGTMAHLARDIEMRREPRSLLPEARSVVVCALSYLTPHPFSVEGEAGARPIISRYAWGRDYHEVLRKRLRRLHRLLDRQAGGTVRARACVDTARVLERSLAARAGLGWIGKNNALIHPRFGSFLFLGELLVDVELEPDEPTRDRCGTCERCLDACPTNALIEPRLLDARRCISYLTIEHRGAIDPALAARIGLRVYGCDVCQEVCPWNRKAQQRVATSVRALWPRPQLVGVEFGDLVFDTEEAFRAFFAATPVRRVRWEGWRRNLALAASNALAASPGRARSSLVEILRRCQVRGDIGKENP